MYCSVYSTVPKYCIFRMEHPRTGSDPISMWHRIGFAVARSTHHKLQWVGFCYQFLLAILPSTWNLSYFCLFWLVGNRFYGLRSRGHLRRSHHRRVRFLAWDCLKSSSYISFFWPFEPLALNWQYLERWGYTNAESRRFWDTWGCATYFIFFGHRMRKDPCYQTYPHFKCF